jgi:hypothetical protein
MPSFFFAVKWYLWGNTPLTDQLQHKERCKFCVISIPRIMYRSFPQFSILTHKKNAKELYLVECKPCPVCDKTCRTSPHLADRLWACQNTVLHIKKLTGKVVNSSLAQELKVPRIMLQADPDPAYYLNVNPDPGSQSNADPDPGKSMRIHADLDHGQTFCHKKYIF